MSGIMFQVLTVYATSVPGKISFPILGLIKIAPQLVFNA